MKRCRNYLPTGPFDQIGPRVRPGLAQTYIGGPFVVRSNPVGAIFDNLRSFCSPLSQVESDDSYTTSDPALNTPEMSTFADAYSAPADSLYFGDLGGPSPSVNGSCGVGTLWDAGIGACVPAPVTATPMSSSPADARAALKAAASNQDCEGVRRVLDMARSQRGKKGSSVYQSWQDIAIRAKTWLESKRRLCG